MKFKRALTNVLLHIRRQSYITTVSHFTLKWSLTVASAFIYLWIYFTFLTQIKLPHEASTVMSPTALLFLITWNSQIGFMLKWGPIRPGSHSALTLTLYPNYTPKSSHPHLLQPNTHFVKSSSRDRKATCPGGISISWADQPPPVSTHL